MFTKNEGQLDRLIRLFTAVVVGILGFFWFGGVAQIILILLSLALLMTALLGFCGLYPLIKVNTLKYTLNKKFKIGFFSFIVLFLVGGSYLSIFFSKKLFLEDFSKMNNEYKQLLFNSGKEKRLESINNYETLLPIYESFKNTYTNYKPFSIRFDSQRDQDLHTIERTLQEISGGVYSGNLAEVHTILEGIRTQFQEILKRNGFSLLTVALVDFHDVMEILIGASDEKNAEKVIESYNLANEKLLEVEKNYLNDEGIKQIRSDLEKLLELAQQNKNEDLSQQAQNLKTSFIKVYLY